MSLEEWGLQIAVAKSHVQQCAHHTILAVKQLYSRCGHCAITLKPAEHFTRQLSAFAYQYLKYLEGSLTCCKILRHETSGFTSHPKEGVLRIFIALKNPLPLPGLNPQPLGPVASTLTTTPPRRRLIHTVKRHGLSPGQIFHRYLDKYTKTIDSGRIWLSPLNSFLFSL
jgi:hypothetical protein